MLAFILRAYLIWLISVANFQDQTGVLVLFFPDNKIFFLNLLSGSLGLLVLVLVTQRKPLAANWVKKLWPKVRMMLIVALLVDFLIQLLAYQQGAISSLSWLIFQALFIITSLVFCYKSKRFNLNLKEFPEPRIQ